MIANGGVEATNNFQRNIDDGYKLIYLCDTNYDASNLRPNKQLGKYLVK